MKEREIESKKNADSINNRKEKCGRELDPRTERVRTRSRDLHVTRVDLTTRLVSRREAHPQFI